MRIDEVFVRMISQPGDPATGNRAGETSFIRDQTCVPDRVAVEILKLLELPLLEVVRRQAAERLSQIDRCRRTQFAK